MKLNSLFRFSGTVFALALLIAPAAAMEWPTGVFKPARLFAQRNESVIECGLTLDDVEAVRAAGYGEVLLTLSPPANMTGFPGTLGTAVLLVHDDDLLTVYGNLDSDSLMTGTGDIESLAIIGSAGNTGWGKKNSLLFQVIDRKKATFLNPLLLLSSIRDTRSPLIRTVIAVNSAGQSISLAGARALRQGSWRLYADIVDTLDGLSTELSPFRVGVAVNGKEQSAIPYETLKAEGGRLVLGNAALNADHLYSDPSRIFLGTIQFVRGRSELVIHTRDASGNERSAAFQIQVE